MTDPTPDTEDAKEALQHGEKPDRGHTPDALHEALTGTDSGSDTRAGSLQGGSASGSDDDPDSAVINKALAAKGKADAAKKPKADPAAETADKPDAPSGDDADAATG